MPINALTQADIADDPENSLIEEVLFLGEKSKTADKKALARAKALEKSGVNPSDILKETGWTKMHGRWNYETDDRNFKQVKRPTEKDSKFFDSYPHPKVEEAYPGLRDRLKVKLVPTIVNGADGAAGGSAEWGAGRINLTPRNADDRTSPLHELQHAIDMEEGWSPRDYEFKLPWTLRRMEARAREAERRMSLTPEQRQSRLPLETINALTARDRSLIASDNAERGRLDERVQRIREREEARPRRKTHKPEAVGISAAVPGISMMRGGADPWKFLEDDR
jgi:hypothetical protein